MNGRPSADYRRRDTPEYDFEQGSLRTTILVAFVSRVNIRGICSLCDELGGKKKKQWDRREAEHFATREKLGVC